MFLDQVSHFEKNLGDQVKGRLPKKLKSLIEVLYVLQVKENILNFDMILSHFRSVFLDRVIHFGGKLGD